jgi:RNA polymerase sigma factor (sigma-70 family)
LKIKTDKIIEQCKRGNPRAEYTLYSKYSKALFNCIFRLVNDRDTSADLLQESFVKIFKSIHRFDYSNGFYTWARRITVNHAISHLKKKGIQFELQEDMTAVDTVPEPQAAIDTPKIEDIRKALDTLSHGYREIFSLYLLEGYDHVEISEILGIKVSTSKTQYMRAKSKVKQELIKKGYGRAI